MNYSLHTFTITFLWFLSCHTNLQCEEKIRIYVSIFELTLQTGMESFNKLKIHKEMSHWSIPMAYRLRVLGIPDNVRQQFCWLTGSWSGPRKCRVQFGAITQERSGGSQVTPDRCGRDVPAHVSCCSIFHVCSLIVIVHHKHNTCWWKLHPHSSEPCLASRHGLRGAQGLPGWAGAPNLFPETGPRTRPPSSHTRASSLQHGVPSWLLDAEITGTLLRPIPELCFPSSVAFSSLGTSDAIVFIGSLPATC